VQNAAPLAEKDPAPHAAHAASDVARAAAEDLPAAHAPHVDAPGLPANFPAPHASHCCSSDIVQVPWMPSS
jgi:hypothetical protein